MLLGLRSKKAIINFDLGEFEITINQGEATNVWLKTLYNQKEYDTDLISVLSADKISSSQFIVHAEEIGQHEIQLQVLDKKKSNLLLSNIITLIVI